MIATDLILQKIKTLDGIINSVVISPEGLIIGSFFSEEVDKDYFSATVLSIFNQVVKQSSRFGKKNPDVICVETDNSIIMLIEMKMEDPFIIYAEFKPELDTVKLNDDVKEAIFSLFKNAI